MTQNWTEDRIRDLLAFARDRAQWPNWNLQMRYETSMLIELVDGELEHPDPRYAPLETKMFEGCEVSTPDLLADFVLANPVDAFGFTPASPPASYWLDLPTGKIDEWTENSLSSLRGR